MATIKIPVRFKGFSIGKGTARIGFAATHDSCSIERACELFVDRRLHATISLGQHDGKPLPGMDDAFDKYHGVFDCKRFSYSPDEISSGLTLAKGDADFDVLAGFVHHSGVLIIAHHEDIPEDAKKRGRKKAESNGQHDPHPDVEAGKDRPHGTPALDAVARLKEDIGRCKIGGKSDLGFAGVVGATMRQKLQNAGFIRVGPALKLLVEEPTSAICATLDVERDGAAELKAKVEGWAKQQGLGAAPEKPAAANGADQPGVISVPLTKATEATVAIVVEHKDGKWFAGADWKSVDLGDGTAVPTENRPRVSRQDAVAAEVSRLIGEFGKHDQQASKAGEQRVEKLLKELKGYLRTVETKGLAPSGSTDQKAPGEGE